MMIKYHTFGGANFVMLWSFVLSGFRVSQGELPI